MPSGTGSPESRFTHTYIDRLVLNAELCRIYARDDSDQANVGAIDAIKEAFGATAAALFYVNGRKERRLCVSGTSFPIALSEERWRGCVESHTGAAAIARFGPWTLPGFDQSLPDWISACLYAEANEGGYVFLGREAKRWEDADSASLADIRATIAPILEIRHQRAVEAQLRVEAESRLARNESRLRDLFEGSRDMIYTADADDRLTDCNLSALSLLGRGAKADLIGRPFSEFALNASDRSLFLQKIASEGYVDDYEIILTKSDGTPVFCLETAHILKHPSGAVRELQGIIKDITQRIESERDLWRTNLELAETNLTLKKTQTLMVQHEKLASIGQLAAGIAHEINNPLGFLISNQRTLEKYFRMNRSAWDEATAAVGPALAASALNAKLGQAFEDCEAIFAESGDGFERIRKIVAGLKDFSRVDRSADFGDFDLNAGIESTLVVAWNEVKYAADVVKRYGDLPLIRAKGNEINQVVLNIVVNAAQAISGRSGGSKGTITIETRREDGTVVVAVKDDGPGIPEEVIKKIFDPFYTTKEPGKGTGLGLSISYDIIVNKHGGKLWAESEPGRGASFFIVLPIAGPPSSQSADS